MGKFNRPGTRPAAFSPIATEQAPSSRTHEGAPGYLRDAKSELYLLAVANLGQDTFYERAKDRDDRFTALVRQLAVEDPTWTAGLLGWLRDSANIRSAAVVGAAEFVHARLEHARAVTPSAADGGMPVGMPQPHRQGARELNRRVVDAVCQRADEPGELLAYWTSKYGRRLPMPVKRGISDAVRRLYNERSFLKWDSDKAGYRFGDVIELVHPKPEPSKSWQGDLFKHAIDCRHNRPIDMIDLDKTTGLSTLVTNHQLRWTVTHHDSGPTHLLDPEQVQAAGMTWEDVLSLGGQHGLDKKQLWEAVIPFMRIMALLRNLRNFDEAGVSDETAEKVAAKISDPGEVAASRLFPFRFWAAYKAAPSLRWGHALERALSHSLANVPALDGRTLILVDRSPSMFPGYYFSTPNRSDITLAEQAAVFGAALALKAANPTLVEFGRTSRAMNVPRGGSVLRLVEQFGQIDGTDIPSAVKEHYDGHDRVIVVTDEQTRAGWLPSNCHGYGGMRETRIDDLIPGHVPTYVWNFAGYKPGAMATGSNRHTFGGLTDQAFAMIPLLERGHSTNWPWQ